MKHTWLVFKQELITVVSRFSFVFAVVILPIISFGIYYGVSLLQREQTGFDIEQVFTPKEEALPEGYVDHAGIIDRVPAGIEDELLPFASDEQAEAALKAGEVGLYYRLPADFMQSGRVTIIQQEYNPISGLGSSGLLNEVIRYNLVGENTEMAERLNNPLVLEKTTLTEDTARDLESPLTYLIPYAVAMLLFMVILTSASLMLSSVAKEKENRMMEILMSSVRPLELLGGKMAALGLAGLLQTVIWAVVGWSLLQLSGRSFDIQLPAQLSPAIILWVVLFFVIGYFLYASLMAGIGALVSSIKEASQLTMLVVMPMTVPLIFSGSLLTQPNGTLSTALSLFPLTSPVAMAARLAANAAVPAWQMISALGLLLLACWWVVRGVSRLFRAQVLLTGQQVSVKRFLRAFIAPGS
ncbi:MAG: ABC transporter permease [Anaerolineae bacterium]|nr:ABC transporter permease [Anaerolineae bacterium]